MNIRQKCYHCSKTYIYIRPYITLPGLDHKETIVYVSTLHPPDEDVAIKHNSVLVAFGHVLHHYPFLHSADNLSIDGEADINNQ